MTIDAWLMVVILGSTFTDLKETARCVHAVVGGGMPGFMLTYTPEKSYASYAQHVFRIKDPTEQAKSTEDSSNTVPGK